MNLDIRPKAVCVLGMHRSGTSTITRAVNLLGAYLGDEKDLGGPAEDNPEGFWERWDINTIDDKMLAFYKKPWDTSMPQAAGWHRSEELLPLKKEVKALISQTFSGKGLWAWKDPRTTLLFEVWKDAVAEAGHDLACIFTVRNPLDVARSLEKRNAFPLDRSFGIWFNYNISALKATSDVRRTFMSFDRFIADWEKEIKRCSIEIGIDWPEDDSLLKKEMSKFVKPELRHSCSGLEELRGVGAPKPVIMLYEMLDGLASSSMRVDAEFNAEIDGLAEDFCSYARFFRSDLEELWDLKKSMRQMRKSLSWKITAPLRKITE